MSAARSVNKQRQTHETAQPVKLCATNEEPEVQPECWPTLEGAHRPYVTETLQFPAAASSRQQLPARACVVCGRQATGRSRYCDGACRQRAYRLRQQPDQQALLAAVTVDLKQQQILLEHIVYSCPSCEQRLLGERRCPECGLMCKKLGVGGHCPHCDELVVVIELVDGELP